MRMREKGEKNMKKISYIENLASWEKDFSFYIPVKVRFCETDMFGHMNNGVAFTYFEEARIEFLKSLVLCKNGHMKRQKQ